MEKSLTIPIADQLFGTWTSECTAPDKLFDGCLVTFFFDQLPFDNEPPTLTLTATVNKQEEHLYKSVPFTIEPADDIEDGFTITLQNGQIARKSFQGNSFLADLPEYGSMILQKRQ